MTEEKSVSTIVGPDGKAIQSERTAPCPRCGRPASERVQSCGFGEYHLICPCGREYKEFTCKNDTW